MEAISGAPDLPVRRATAALGGAARERQPERATSGRTWRTTGEPRAARAAEAQSDPVIDLDVLWEELDGLLGQAAASSGAHRVLPLRPHAGDVAAAYRAGSRGFAERFALVDAFA